MGATQKDSVRCQTVLVGQGTNTPVYDRLHLLIKPGFTWKNCHIDAGRCLRVRQGL